MRIDPHTHSSYSDGTDTPAALMAAAAEAGLDVVGLTDHDTFAGWDEAAGAVESSGVALLRGVEISCMWQCITLHLLAYLPRPDDEELLRAFRQSQESRLGRAQRMTELLSEDFPITWEDVQEQASASKTIGRPHIADALVAAGAFPDRSAAFAGALMPGGPYYVGQWAVDPVEACRLVRAAGGVPVAAHPRARGRQAVLVPDHVFGAMAEEGLAALEVDHRDHSASERKSTAKLAADLGLMVSGSSDYHGAGKPNRLGENLMAPELLERIVDEGALALLTP